MATVYIAPTAQGTGDGSSAANAYAYSSLSSAESDAGTGGTIIFLDGTYSAGATQTWDAPQVTYESQNLHGAIIDGGGSNRQLVYQDNTVKKFFFKEFRFNWSATSTGTATFEDIKVKCAVAFQVLNNPGYFGGNAAGKNQNWTRCEFDLDVSTSSGTDNRFFKTSSSAMVYNHCTFYLRTSGASADAFVTTGTNLTFKNTILEATDATTFGTSWNFASNGTNCCIHNVDNNSSGGTNNIFADPQFVDSANGDFRLRPSSPCINAGTAS